MRIGIDVDEVVAELHATWIAAYNRVYKDDMTTADITTWDIHKIVKPECGRRIFDFLQPQLYDAVRPVEGAQYDCERIRRMGHEVYFVTSCGKSGHDRDMAARKQAWLREHGFLKFTEGLHTGHILIGADKSEVPVHVLIDDHIINANRFKGHAVLVTRPHNADYDTYHLRVNHVGEFANILWEQRVA